MPPKKASNASAVGEAGDSNSLPNSATEADGKDSHEPQPATTNGTQGNTNTDMSSVLTALTTMMSLQQETQRAMMSLQQEAQRQQQVAQEQQISLLTRLLDRMDRVDTSVRGAPSASGASGDQESTDQRREQVYNTLPAQDNQARQSGVLPTSSAATDESKTDSPGRVGAVAMGSGTGNTTAEIRRKCKALTTIKLGTIQPPGAVVRAHTEAKVKNGKMEMVQPISLTSFLEWTKSLSKEGLLDLLTHDNTDQGIANALRAQQKELFRRSLLVGDDEDLYLNDPQMKKVLENAMALEQDVLMDAMRMAVEYEFYTSTQQVERGGLITARQLYQRMIESFKNPDAESTKHRIMHSLRIIQSNHRIESIRSLCRRANDSFTDFEYTIGQVVPLHTRIQVVLTACKGVKVYHDYIGPNIDRLKQATSVANLETMLERMEKYYHSDSDLVSASQVAEANGPRRIHADVHQGFRRTSSHHSAFMSNTTGGNHANNRGDVSRNNSNSSSRGSQQGGRRDDQVSRKSKKCFVCLRLLDDPGHSIPCRKRVVCRLCRQPGHYASDCPTNRDSREGPKVEQALVAVSRQHETTKQDNRQETTRGHRPKGIQEPRMILDTGATSSMIGRNAPMTQLKPVNVKVEGIAGTTVVNQQGIASLELENGNSFEFPAFTNDEIQHNLLSAQTLADQSMVIVFTKYNAKAFKHADVEMDLKYLFDREPAITATRENGHGHWVVDQKLENRTDDAVPTGFDDQVERSHHVLKAELLEKKDTDQVMSDGEIELTEEEIPTNRSEKVIDLIGISSFRGLTKQQIHERTGHLGSGEDCDSCKRSKVIPQMHHHFRTPPEFFEPGHLVTIDLLEVSVRGMNENRYLVVGVDAATGLMFAHPIIRKTADEVSRGLARFRSQSLRWGRTIKCIRSDQGSEFTAAHTRRTLGEAGIATQYAGVGDKRPVGIVERAHRTLLQMLRCVQTHAGATVRTWDWVIAAVAMIYNIRTRSRRTPAYSKARDFCDLMVPPTLNVLFQDVVVTLKGARRNKLAEHNIAAIWLGPGEMALSSHKVYLPSEQKMVETQHVIVPNGEPTFNAIRNLSARVDESFGDREAVPLLNWERLEDAIVNDTLKGMETGFPYQEEVKTQSDLLRQLQEQNEFKENQGFLATSSRIGGETTPRGIMNTPITENGEIIHGTIEIAKAYKLGFLEKPEVTAAIEKEYQSQMEHKTYELVDKIPKNEKIINAMCLLTYKQMAGTGCPEGWKARLVACGNQKTMQLDRNAWTQSEHILSNSSPTLRSDNMRAIVAFAVHHGFELRSFDVSTAYLHATLSAPIYIMLPRNFDPEADKSGRRIAKVTKALPGDPEAGRAWHEELSQGLAELGANRLVNEKCIWTFGTEKGKILLGIYVDDGLVAVHPDFLDKWKKLFEEMQKKYRIKPEGKLTNFLGCRFDGDPVKGSVTIIPTKAVDSLIKGADQENAAPKNMPMTPKSESHLVGECEKHKQDPTPKDEKTRVLTPQERTTYQSIVGSLQYIAQIARPDLSFVASFLGTFASSPTTTHLTAARHAVKYLKGTRDKGLEYSRKQNVRKLIIFTDASLGNATKGRSYSGAAIYYYGNLVSWSACVQDVVSTSTANAEYVAGSQGYHRLLAIQHVVNEIEETNDIKDNNEEIPLMLIDNQCAIKQCKNYSGTSKIRHLNLAVWNLKNAWDDNKLDMAYVQSADNIADVFTKPVDRKALDRLLAGSVKLNF